MQVPPPLQKPWGTFSGGTPGNGQERLAWAMLPGGWKEDSSHLSLDVPLHALKPSDTFTQTVPLGNKGVCSAPDSSLLVLTV